MGLKEKLADITKKTEEIKILEKKRAQDKNLLPIRNRIKELEEQKYQLSLLKNSLKLKSVNNTGEEIIGKGMKEYSNETGSLIKKESDNLDTLIEKNKEGLKSIGVENKDQLVENPEFTREDEVVNYKEAKKQEEELNISDKALQKRLKSFGIEIDTKKFNYKIAKKLLSDKLELLENELLSEKLKTPEGKEEAIEKISKDLQEKIPEVSFSKNEETGVLSLNQGKGKIIVSNKKIKFEGWNKCNLLLLVPAEMDTLEKTYSLEVIKMAFEEAYKNKIDESFKKFDSRNENNQYLREQLELVNPQEGNKARNLFKEFFELQNEFKKVIKEKSNELKKKGFDFDDKNPYNYGISYEDLIQFGRDETTKELSIILQNTNFFPPKVDYKKLQIKIEKKKQYLQKFIEDIKSLKTEEDIKKFERGSGIYKQDSVVAKFHGDMMDNELNISKIKTIFTQNQNSSKTESIKELKSEAETYIEAKKYLDDRITNLNKSKGKVLAEVNLAIDTSIKIKELLKEMEIQNFGKSLFDIEYEIDKIEKEKKEAVNLTTELIKLELKLPKESLTLEGNEIKVSSISKKLELNKKDKLNKQKELNILKEKISEYKMKEPKFFKNGWVKKMTELTQKQKNLETKISEIDKNNDKLYSECYFHIPTENLYYLEDLVKKQPHIEGKPDEIFTNLKSQLDEITSRKPPESIIKMFEEYKKLEKQLD